MRDKNYFIGLILLQDLRDQRNFGVVVKRYRWKTEIRMLEIESDVVLVMTGF